MDYERLQEHILELANLTETDEPMVSCYLNLESAYRPLLNERVCALKQGIERRRRQSFWEAIGRLEYFLLKNSLFESKSAAIFSRGGRHPFFMPLRFGVPLDTRVSAGSAPDIFPLVGVRDVCRRILVLFAVKGDLRIIEIDTDIAKNRIQYHERKGRERIEEQHGRRTPNRKFADAIELLAEAVAEGSFGHWILAGEPRMTLKIANAIPNPLGAKLVSILRVSGKDGNSIIAAKALTALAEFETRSRIGAQANLAREIGRGGQAVSGTVPTLNALRTGRANLLLMSRDYEPDRGWSCRACRELTVADQKPAACPGCGSAGLYELSIRDEMVRTAVRNGCSLQILEPGASIAALGNVGCRLHYSSTDGCENVDPDPRQANGHGARL